MSKIRNINFLHAPWYISHSDYVLYKHFADYIPCYVIGSTQIQLQVLLEFPSVEPGALVSSDQIILKNGLNQTLKWNTKCSWKEGLERSLKRRKRGSSGWSMIYSLLFFSELFFTLKDRVLWTGVQSDVYLGHTLFCVSSRKVFFYFSGLHFCFRELV